MNSTFLLPPPTRLFLTHLIDIDMTDRPWRPEEKTASELPPHLHYACRLQLHAAAISPTTQRTLAHGTLTFTEAGTRCLNPSGLTGHSTHVCLLQEPQIPFVISVLSPRHLLASFQWHKNWKWNGTLFVVVDKYCNINGHQSCWHRWKLLNNKTPWNLLVCCV